MYSVNPFTQKSYPISPRLNDKQNIDAFLNKHLGKKIVVVQGLGFVGAVMSIVVANALTEEYAVIGIDLPTKEAYWKIRTINEGVFPIPSSDKKVEKFFQNAINKGNLYATYDSYAYAKADIVIVDINLDVQKESDRDKTLNSYNVSLKGFEGAIISIAENCKDDLLLLIETTVPPGTCEKVVKPIVDQVFERKQKRKKYKIGHSYERVMPGPNYVDSIQNFYRVYSGINEESADAVEIFLKSIIRTDQYPLTRLHNTSATEMAKVLENSFRAMNIAFVQEWTEFAEEANVNLFEVVKAIRMRPTHQNLMLPGLGVGGYCLTKDPLLASWSRQELFDGSGPLFQSEKAVHINDKMPLHTFNRIMRLMGSKVENKVIALLGVSYLSDVGDTRYTPVELLYRKLKDKGADLVLNDPFVPYWEEAEIDVETTLEPFFKNDFDILVITTAHSTYKNNDELDRFVLNNKPAKIIDCWGILSNEAIKKYGSKHEIYAIGRGYV